MKRLFRRFPWIALAACLVLAGIAAGLGQIPDGIFELDISPTDIYSVSDATKTALAALTDDIELTILASEAGIDARLIKFINKYAGLSSHIAVYQFDPALEPNIADALGAEAGDLVIACPATGRSMSVPLGGFDTGLVLFDQMRYYVSGQLVPVSFDADGQITRAVNYVTGAQSQKLYLLSGHNESAFPGGARSRVEKANIEFGEVNLLQEGAIPKDCDLLVCYDPHADIAGEELEVIGAYLRSGGRLMLLLDSAEYQGFNRLLADYGLQILPGYAGDTERYYKQYADYYGFNCIYPVLAATGDVTGGITNDALLLFPRAMTQVTPNRRNVTVSPFMSTSASGSSFTSADDAVTGTYVLGAVATETADAGLPPTRLTVISAALMIDDDITGSIPGASNLDIFTNAVTANFDGSRLVSIPAKAMAITYNSFKSIGAWSVFFLAIVPAGFLIVGLSVWLRRRWR